MKAYTDSVTGSHDNPRFLREKINRVPFWSTLRADIRRFYAKRQAGAADDKDERRLDEALARLQ